MPQLQLPVATALVDRHPDQQFVLAGGFVNNLLNTHPAFQVDGNFGYAAGVCEMLVQSHLGYIQLLPAIPEQWPDGSVAGIRARGGFELDVAWRAGRLATAMIRSQRGGTCRLLVVGPISVTKDGKEVPVEREGDIASFPTLANEQYVIGSFNTKAPSR